jgi:hypothetical protein
VYVRVCEYAGSPLRLSAHDGKRPPSGARSEKCIGYMNIYSPILAPKRPVAGVPGGVGEASNILSISMSCEESGEAEGGEEMGRTATHLVVSISFTYY